MDLDESGKLVIQTRGGRRYEFQLVRLPVTIGRASDCDVVLDDQFVSRHHARIVARGGGHAIVDQDSRNGTLVAGSKIREPRPLAFGDEIQIGDTTLTYLEAEANTSTTAILNPTAEAVSGAGLQVDESNWEVLLDGRKLPMRLPPLEFKLLAYLAARTSAVCTRDELAIALWGEGSYSYDMLHQLVHRLKQRLAASAHNAPPLITIRGVGYKLGSSAEES